MQHLKTYTVYLPAHVYEPLPVGKLTYQATSNTAIFYPNGKPEIRYASVAAALNGIKQIYPDAFLEEN